MPISVNRRRFLKSGVMAGAGLLLAGCAGRLEAAPATNPTPGAANTTPKRGGTMRIAFSGAPQTFDPAIMTLNEEYTATLAIYNNLVRVDPRLQPQPELATKWSASDDLKTWTFTLRDDVVFHHGKRFTADDAVFTFNRLLDPATASPARSVLSFVDGVEKIDDHTIQFILKEANADLPIFIGFVQGRILPSDRSEEQFAKEPSGTGPFTLKKWNPGNYLILERNPHYWQPGLPYLDQVSHYTIPEQMGQIAALEGNTVDMMFEVAPESAVLVEANPNLNLLQAESGLYQPIVVRCDKPPFTDVRVRTAMKLVADRPAIKKVVLQGFGSLGNDHPVSKVSPFHADLEQRARNIEQAKQVLAEAGHTDGLNLDLYTTTGTPGMVEHAIAFQEMAAPAGIKVEIHQVPVSIYWSDYWLKKDLLVSNWNFRPSIDETLATAFTSKALWNESYWKNEEADKLISQARGESNESKRKELYARIQKLIRDDGGIVVPYFKPVLNAVRKSVHNFQIHPATWVDVREVWLG